MPMYDYKCKSCEVITTEMRRIAARNDASTCESCGGSEVSIQLGMPAVLYSGVGSVYGTTSDGWKDRLKTIQKNNPLGNINS